MKTKKGVVLPVAILLCAFLLLISFSVASLVLVNSTSVVVNNVSLNNRLIFEKSYHEFINGESISDNTFTWESYTKEDDTNVKAIVAYRGQEEIDNIRFYAIYDFDQGKTLAYQTSSFYITYVEDVPYLGGLVKVSN